MTEIMIDGVCLGERYEEDDQREPVAVIFMGDQFAYSKFYLDDGITYVVPAWWGKYHEFFGWSSV